MSGNMIILTLFSLLLLQYTDGGILTGICMYETATFQLRNLSVALISPAMNHTYCCQLCRWTEYTYCLIAYNSTICYCADTYDTAKTAYYDQSCSVSCPSYHLEMACPFYIRIYSTLAGSPNFTLNAIQSSTAVTLSVGFNSTPAEVFFVNFGDGSPTANFYTWSSSRVRYGMTFAALPYLNSGSYNITVVGNVAGTLATSMQMQSIATGPSSASISLVACPVIAYTNVSYKCNVSVSYMNSSHFYNVTFSDSPTESTILQHIGNRNITIGTITPKGPTNEADSNGTAVSDEILLINHPITVLGQLFAVDILPFYNGPLTVSLLTATCPSGLQYCMHLGFCMITCAEDPLLNTFSCPDEPFCYIDDVCCANETTGIEANWTVVKSATGTGKNRTTIRLPFTKQNVQPGYVLNVVGSVSRSSQTGPGGDTVNGNLTNYNHYVMMTIMEFINISITHTCMTVDQNATINITDGYVPINVYPGVLPSTMCQRNISLLNVTVNQSETFAYNGSLNLADPFYVWVDYVFSIVNSFSEAGPIYFNITFTPIVTGNATESYLNDYPYVEGLSHEILINRTITSPGEYEVGMVAYNYHNLIPDTYTGLIPPVRMNNITIYALYPVSPAWTVAVNPYVALRGTFQIPTKVPSVIFQDSNAWTFPTNATVTINWGDGTPPTTVNFDDPGTAQPIVDHSYLKGGLFVVNCSIENAVSAVFNLITNVTIYEKITNFNVTNMYMPNAVIGMEPGFGLDYSQFPIDKELIFLPTMTTGTVDSYLLQFTSNGSLIQNYTVADRFHPCVSFNYDFNYTAILNLTVIAKNLYESVPVNLYAEMIGLIRGLKIDDFSIVTQGGQSKMFHITFVSFAGATCLLINYGDLTPYKAIGNEASCLRNYSFIPYDSTIQLASSFNISHVYESNNIYNITVMAFNDLNKDSDILQFAVTNMLCSPPTLILLEQSMDFLTATRIYKGNKNFITAIATLNCSITQKTKKHWQLYNINATNGEQGPAINVKDIIPTWNSSELEIPNAFLDSGKYYMCQYTISMYDPPVLNPIWTFQKQMKHYIYVEATPLIPKLTSSGITEATIGLPQSALLQPALYTVDPDYPNSPNFIITWKCRTVGENWTSSVLGTGCFGNGPGYVNYSNSQWQIFGSNFRDLGAYEIAAEIQNNSRTDSVSMFLNIVKDAVPILSVSCSSDVLCVPAQDKVGVYVNPNNRLGLIATCTSGCSVPPKYEWTAYHLPENTPITIADQYMPIGANGSDFSLASSFFTANPLIQFFKLGVISTNGNAKGSASYYIHVNQRPRSGLCSIDKYTGVVIMDTFTLTCTGWVDPEAIGIDFYVIRLYQNQTSPSTLMQQRQQTLPAQIFTLAMPVGVYIVEITIQDLWGATTVVNITEQVTVKMLTEAHFATLDTSTLIARYLGGGNVNMLNMLINAQNSIIDSAPWLNVNDGNVSASELQRRMLLVNEMYSQGISALQTTMNFNTQGIAEASAGILSNIMEKASQTPNSALTVDLFTRGDIYDLLDQMVTQIGKLPLGTPNDLTKLVQCVSTIAAGLVVGVEEVTTPGCSSIPPKDSTQNANSVDYDTEVKSIEMVIPSDVNDAKKCNILDLTTSQSQLQMPRLQGIVDRMGKYVLQKQVAGEALTVSTNNNMTVVNKIVPGESLTGIHECGKSSVEFPASFCPTGNCSDSVALSLKEWPTLTYMAAPSSDLLTGGTRILDVLLYDRWMNQLNVLDFQGEIMLLLYRTLYKRGNSSASNAQVVNATSETAMQSIPIIYTMFVNDKISTSTSIEITPSSQNHSRLILMIMKDEQPTLNNYDNFTFVEDIEIFDNGTYTYFIETATGMNETGNYYIGVAEFKETIQIPQIKNLKTTKSSMSLLRKPMTTDYEINIFIGGCYFYDGQDWSASNLQVVGADTTSVKCLTNHLTSFGGSLFTAPNTIDFSFVFAHMGFSDNLTIYVTLIVSFSIFVLMMIWAKWQDKKDLTKLGATPLPDNMATDKYLYEVLVYTGNCKEAQTDSTVQFVLSGDYGDTEVRTFADGNRSIFRRANIDVFVMAVPKSLGPLSFLRIWHDNTGKGPNASWKLNFIVFRDVQTGRKYEFICNNWFGVEKSDGQIERVLGVAGREDKGEFGHLFPNTASKNLSDGHLWLSVFTRPPRSRFTRCQRVASCFALLFLTMLVNAMWYSKVPSQSSGDFTIGPFNLSPPQIVVGVMSNLIVFLPSFLIVFLFKYSKPRKLRKSRIQEALKKASKETMKAKYGENWGEKEEENEEEAIEEKKEISKAEQTILTKKLEKKNRKKRRKISLPWFCKYVAWILSIVCIVASTFFLLSYGIMFGNEKATKWISSIFIAFFTSMILIQPIKVIITAMFMSMISKDIDLDEDDADDDEEKPELQSDELWLFEGEKRPKLGYGSGTVHTDLLAELRQLRLREIQNWDIVKELLGYGVFLWILLVISYGGRDVASYYLKNSLEKTFVNFGQQDGSAFLQLVSTDDFWLYLCKGLMPQLRADVLYNGKPPYGLRGFLNDYNNRIMGYATIRQIRTKKNTCSISPTMRKMVDDCAGFSELVKEENRHYCTGWAIPNTLTRNTSACQAPEFRYKTATQLQSLPIWGQKDWYGGGGYVISLSGSTPDILKRFQFLQKNFWINADTRAVMIEFSTYNSQVNLFGICTLMVEFLPGSGIFPNYRFDAINLFPSNDNFGTFIVVCEILFCIFVVYFTLHELRLVCKLKVKYFDSYWSLAELSILIVSYCSIILHFVRAFVTTNSVKVFQRTFGNGYVRMTYAAAINEYYNYAIAFLVFTGIIKFIKLLRFNKRMGFLSATLRKCWEDLVGFLMAFCICFSSFVLMFFFLIGTNVVDFSTIIGALATCFSMMMGKFQFNEMSKANPLAPVMFFIFVLCNSWVLLNLLLTLIIRSFEEVKLEIMNKKDEYELSEFVFTQFKKFIGKKESPKPIVPLGIAADENNQDKNVNNNVTELPSKVDRFLDYVNLVYFDGAMDLKNKGAMKESFSQSGRRRILGAEGNVGVNRKGFSITQESLITPRSMFTSGE